jgi:hypothetical protein
MCRVWFRLRNDCPWLSSQIVKLEFKISLTRSNSGLRSLKTIRRLFQELGGSLNLVEVRVVVCFFEALEVMAPVSRLAGIAFSSRVNSECKGRR